MDLRIKANVEGSNQSVHVLTTIFNRLVCHTVNTSIFRLASCSQLLHSTFCKYLLERIVEKVARVANDQSGLIEESNLLLGFRSLLFEDQAPYNSKIFWLSIFDKVTKRISLDEDFLFSYVLSGLIQRDRISVRNSLYILKFLINQNLLKAPFSTIINKLINHLVLQLEHNDRYIKSDAKKCFKKILATKQAYTNSIEDASLQPYEGLTLDIFKIIYKAAFYLDATRETGSLFKSTKEISSSCPFRSVARMGSTCKDLHILAREYILKEFVKWAPKIGYAHANIDGWDNPSLPSQCVKVNPQNAYPKPRPKIMFMAPMQYPASVFENLITNSPQHITCVVDHLVRGFRSNEEHDIQSEFSVLRRLMSKESLKNLCLPHFPTIGTAVIECLQSRKKNRLWQSLQLLESFINLELVENAVVISAIPQLSILLSHQENSVSRNARCCFLKIFEKSLITPGSPYLNGIITPLTDSICKPSNRLFPSYNPHTILLVMFQKELITKESEHFLKIVNKILTIDDTKFIYEYLLELCLINKSLENAILNIYKNLITEAILYAIVSEEYKDSKLDNIIRLMKSIIDSEPSYWSECCQLVIKEDQRLHENYLNYYSHRENWIYPDFYKLIKELALYVHYKASWLPISFETYQSIWKE